MATTITVIIAAIVILLIRHHVNMWREGKRYIELQHEVQRLLKRLSNDFRMVNAPVVVDRKLNIWLGGEDLAEMEISPVELKDTDENKENGSEELVIRHYLFEPLGRERVIKYYLDREAGGLVRETDGRKQLFSDKVTEMHFDGDKDDLKKICLKATVIIPARQNVSKKEEILEAVFRMKSDFITVK